MHNTGGGEDPTYYTYNAHTDVQAITDATGNTKATYGYTAYGADDVSQDTGVDKNTRNGATGTTTANPYNVYRFNAKRIDSDTGNYDMGFRNYDPGLNRFLTRDMYEGAFADTRMTSDPYTGNRYAFADGNPLSNIELDGHDMVGDLVNNLLAPPPPPPNPDAPPLPLATNTTTSSNATSNTSQTPQQTGTQDFSRYLSARNFIYGQIFNMLGSQQFQDISTELQLAGNAPLMEGSDPSANTEAALVMWAGMVGPNQPWDFKSPVRDAIGSNEPQPGELRNYTRFNEDPQVQLYYNIWAYISYGYVGRAAGFDASTLQGGAQANAKAWGTDSGGNWVGRQIDIDLYEDYKPDQLTPDAIDDEIKKHLPALQPYSEYQPFPAYAHPSPWVRGVSGDNFWNPPIHLPSSY